MSNWFIGTYGPDLKGTGRGIYSASTGSDGRLVIGDLVAEANSPSFLMQRGNRLFATLESSGVVQSYLVDSGLELEWSARSGGELPCHLTAVGNSVLVANYLNGVLGLISDGELVQALAGEGASPHAHSSIFLDDITLASVDLGSDLLYLHTLSEGRLERTSSVALPAGTGPRDIARHPSGLLYVLSELSNELLAFQWRRGVLELVSTVAVPGAMPGDHGSGISFGPGGHYVYTGLRGSQRIAVFRVEKGMPEAVGWVSSGGDWPRHHATDGDVLHVANQESNSIVSFRLREDGMPAQIGEPVAVPSPTYLLRALVV